VCIQFLKLPWFSLTEKRASELKKLLDVHFPQQDERSYDSCDTEFIKESLLEFYENGPYADESTEDFVITTADSWLIFFATSLDCHQLSALAFDMRIWELDEIIMPDHEHHEIYETLIRFAREDLKQQFKRS
jgi:hypothetical protein